MARVAQSSSISDSQVSKDKHQFSGSEQIKKGKTVVFLHILRVHFKSSANLCPAHSDFIKMNVTLGGCVKRVQKTVGSDNQPSRRNLMLIKVQLFAPRGRGGIIMFCVQSYCSWSCRRHGLIDTIGTHAEERITHLDDCSNPSTPVGAQNIPLASLQTKVPPRSYNYHTANVIYSHPNIYHHSYMNLRGHVSASHYS